VSIGKILMLVGVFLFLFGFVSQILTYFGINKLPGSLTFTKGQYTFYFPIVPCIIISLVLSFLLNVFFKR
jgi:hypothetical protein